PKKVTLDFISKGHVHFLADTQLEKNIEISDERSGNNKGTVTIHGIVYEDPKTFNDMPVKFIANKTNTNPTPTYNITIKPGWTQQLSVDTEAMGWNGVAQSSPVGFSIPNVTGGTHVEGGDWTLLTFKGKMTENYASPGSENQGFAEEPLMEFTVKGGVEANGNDGLSIKETNTPFGDFKTVFDFANKRLVGSLTKKSTPPPLTLPGININEGAVEFCGDPAGFYVAGGFKTFVTIPFIQGDYNLGFMLGSYTNGGRLKSEVWPLVTRFKDPLVYSECYPNYINWQLKGFYFTLDRILFNVKEDYDFVVAGGGVKAYASVGADIFANFSGKATAGMSAIMKFYLEAYLNAITGTSIEGSLDAQSLFSCYVSGNEFILALMLDLSVHAKIDQWPVGTVFDKTVHGHLGGSTNSGLSFSLGGGGGNRTTNCPTFK
ncbi:MAG: hypothetical protein FWE99_06145, partial [Bacteroidales bacterium]|nr:hypothetical protein [Bacteroidales bacterium]